jgi:hypothetical protein
MTSAATAPPAMSWTSASKGSASATTGAVKNTGPPWLPRASFKRCTASWTAAGIVAPAATMPRPRSAASAAPARFTHCPTRSSAAGSDGADTSARRRATSAGISDASTATWKSALALVRLGVEAAECSASSGPALAEARRASTQSRAWPIWAGPGSRKSPSSATTTRAAANA